MAATRLPSSHTTIATSARTKIQRRYRFVDCIEEESSVVTGELAESTPCIDSTLRESCGPLILTRSDSGSGLGITRLTSGSIRTEFAFVAISVTCCSGFCSSSRKSFIEFESLMFATRTFGKIPSENAVLTPARSGVIKATINPVARTPCCLGSELKQRAKQIATTKHREAIPAALKRNTSCVSENNMGRSSTIYLFLVFLATLLDA